MILICLKKNVTGLAALKPVNGHTIWKRKETYFIMPNVVYMHIQRSCFVIILILQTT